MGEEDDGFVDDSDDSDLDDLDDDAEFEKTKKQLAKFNNGELDDDDDIDDEDDSDYEEAAGDANLYDSKLDDIDELKYMQETITGLSQN